MATPIPRTDPEGLSLDPHGEHRHDHGHVIVSFSTLTAVLVTLVLFTVLTVAASRAEIWISDEFNLHIPQWVNVAIALSIAAVKSSLVLMFFMQLKYDNRLNSLIFGFCLFAAALFLGLTMGELGTRGTIYGFANDYEKRGGSGVQLRKAVVNPDTGKVERVDIGGPIVDFVRNRWIDQHGVEAWEEKLALFHHLEHAAPEQSTPDRSRPRTGITPGLFSDTPKDGGHAPAGRGGH